MATIDVAKGKAIVIRDEVEDGRNTATRVGEALLSTCQAVEEIKEFDDIDFSYSSYDLEIGDPSKRAIVRFYDGHIKTRYFDSKNVYTKTEVEALIAKAIKECCGGSSSGGSGGSGSGGSSSGGDSGGSGSGGSDSGSTVVTPSDSIKMLILGNSFTLDALSVVPKLMEELLPGVTYKIGHYYCSGLTLANLDTQLGWGDTVPSDKVTTHYQYYELTKSGYTHANGVVPLAAVKKDTWDWIIFQQGTQGQTISSYKTDVTSCKSQISAAISYTPKWGFLHAQDYVEKSNAHSVQSANIKELMTSGLILSQIPCGTACENLRTISRMADYGTNGNLLYDSIHLNTGIGMFVESLVVVQWINNVIGKSANISNSTLYPSTSSYYTYTRGDVYGITTQNCSVARKAATFAMSKPYEITNMNAYDS